ncbi:MAG: transcriptional regulator, partial [Mesorhizobium sp.]
DELRHEHLGAPSDTPPDATVRATLQAGYEAVVARKALGAGCDAGA